MAARTYAPRGYGPQPEGESSLSLATCHLPSSPCDAPSILDSPLSTHCHPPPLPVSSPATALTDTSVRKAASEKPNAGPSVRELELERLLSHHGISVPRHSLPPEGETRKNTEPLTSPRRSSSPSRIVERRTIPTLVSDERTAQPLSPQTVSTLFDPALEPTGLEAFVEATTQLEAAADASRSQAQPQQNGSIPLSAHSRMEAPPNISPSTNANNFPARPPSHHSLSRSTLTDPERDGGLPYDDGLSSGTLVIAAGRSKYFGPRAGNEWLKDVSVTARVPG